MQKELDEQRPKIRDMEILLGRLTERLSRKIRRNMDSNNPSEVSIRERGYREAKTAMHFIEQRKAELVIVRNGAKGSNQITYLIYPK